MMAERQGFEPWIPCGIHAFQACAFSHSAISPLAMRPHKIRTRSLLNLTQRERRSSPPGVLCECPFERSHRISGRIIYDGPITLKERSHSMSSPNQAAWIDRWWPLLVIAYGVLFVSFLVCF